MLLRRSIVYRFLLILLIAEATTDRIPQRVLIHLMQSRTKEEFFTRTGAKIIDRRTEPLIRRSKFGHTAVKNSFGNDFNIEMLLENNNLTTNSNRGNRTLIDVMATEELSDHQHSGVVMPQAHDSCFLKPMCVPLPVTVNHSQYILHYPLCIELPRCIGGCCSQSKSCIPQQTSNVSVLVTYYRLLEGNDPRVLNETDDATVEQIGSAYVPMERHIKCSCQGTTLEYDVNDQLFTTPRQLET